MDNDSDIKEEDNAIKGGTTKFPHAVLLYRRQRGEGHCGEFCGRDITRCGLWPSKLRPLPEPNHYHENVLTSHPHWVHKQVVAQVTSYTYTFNGIIY